MTCMNIFGRLDFQSHTKPKHVSTCQHYVVSQPPPQNDTVWTLLPLHSTNNAPGSFLKTTGPHEVGFSLSSSFVSFFPPKQQQPLHIYIIIFYGLKPFRLRPLTSSSRHLHKSHRLIFRDDRDDDEETVDHEVNDCYNYAFAHNERTLSIGAVWEFVVRKNSSTLH